MTVPGVEVMDWGVQVREFMDFVGCGEDKDMRDWEEGVRELLKVIELLGGTGVTICP